jgi:hypothetical protein
VTRRPSGRTTIVGLVGSSNVTTPAPWVTSPAVTRAAPWVPASEEPKPSIRNTRGNRSSTRSRMAGDIGAPPFEKMSSDDTS